MRAFLASVASIMCLRPSLCPLSVDAPAQSAFQGNLTASTQRVVRQRLDSCALLAYLRHEHGCNCLCSHPIPFVGYAPGWFCTCNMDPVDRPSEKLDNEMADLIAKVEAARNAYVRAKNPLQKGRAEEVL